MVNKINLFKATFKGDRKRVLPTFGFAPAASKEEINRVARSLYRGRPSLYFCMMLWE